MFRSALFTCLNATVAVLLSGAGAALAAADMPVPGGVPWWGYRGYLGSGINQGDPPVFASDQTGANILWKVPLPNWGHGQPVVLGDRVVVVSEGGWPQGRDFPILQCFALEDGALLWELELDHVAQTGLSAEEQAAARTGWANVLADFRLNYTLFNQIATAKDEATKQAAHAKFAELGRKIGPYRRGYGQLRSLKPKCKKEDMDAARKAGFTLETWQHDCGMSQAAFGQTFPTPVTDGEAVYVVTAWGSFFAVDRNGKMLWSAFYPGKAGEYCRNGRSPLIYGDLLISDITGKVRGIDRTTGQLRWSHEVLTETWMNPVVTTVGDTDVLLCFNKKAFRLPDGQPLVIEGGTDFGAMAVVKYDERDVVYFTGGGEHGGWEKKGNGPTPPPSALRFSLAGEVLKAEILWHKANGQVSRSHTGILYHDGVFYHAPTGSHYDPLTGALLRGPGNGKEARDRGLLAKSAHMFYINTRPDGRQQMYGLREDKEVGVLNAKTLDGADLADSRFFNAPVTGEKQTQIIEQHGFDSWGRFSYSRPFTVFGDHIIIRGYDYLWCLGHTARGAAPQQDRIAKASAAELLGLLEDPDARTRRAVVERLGQLKDAGASETLVALIDSDAHPEVRAAAVRAADAIDPTGKPGSAKLRSWLVPIASGGMRLWYKPEHMQPWQDHKHILPALGVDAAAAIIPVLADKDEWQAATGVFMLKLIDWRQSDEIRQALIVLSKTGKGRGCVAATGLLARQPVHADSLALFEELVATAKDGNGEHLKIAVRAVAGSKADAERGAWLLEQVAATQSIAVLEQAAALAWRQDPVPATLMATLVSRATSDDPGHRTPRTATVAMRGSTDKQAAADALLQVLEGGKSWWVKNPAIDGLFSLNVAHQSEALEALNAVIKDDPKHQTNKEAASLLERHVSRLEDPGLRQQAVVTLKRLLAIANWEVQSRALTGLGRLPKDEITSCKPELEKLQNDQNKKVAEAAGKLLKKISQ